ncbi:hypothetical protein [Mucilaginibacter gotjawali]|uniref:Uncharacterized protein YneF (UPF0154 family) n=1 Tax=Mucilaginibacter gotjawali TaxID=1550579 RepID=A0A839SB89_9SPHI|nr:hypothetical protein [Mucilaginibacter gotjawali]MBB3054624.1 uncharacterized protein YneF (UPF0154 family) [Mucilaginibacter gotjawali]
MTLSDVTLIGKKILVGIVVTIIPFLIIFGGLWLTRKLLADHDRANQQITQPTKSTAS